MERHAQGLPCGPGPLLAWLACHSQGLLPLAMNPTPVSLLHFSQLPGPQFPGCGLKRRAAVETRPGWAEGCSEKGRQELCGPPPATGATAPGTVGLGWGALRSHALEALMGQGCCMV